MHYNAVAEGKDRETGTFPHTTPITVLYHERFLLRNVFRGALYFQPPATYYFDPPALATETEKKK